VKCSDDFLSGTVEVLVAQALDDLEEARLEIEVLLRTIAHLAREAVADSSGSVFPTRRETKLNRYSVLAVPLMHV
jgi:hypothetical protein